MLQLKTKFESVEQVLPCCVRIVKVLVPIWLEVLRFIVDDQVDVVLARHVVYLLLDVLAVAPVVAVHFVLGHECFVVFNEFVKRLSKLFIKFGVDESVVLFLIC